MKIFYQGSPGAYSHLAAEKIYPNNEFISCKTFEECFKYCNENENCKTIIPVENSIAGRVADIQYLINKWLYDKRDKTDQKNEFIFSEITREKVFQLINKEIPYDISVTTEINLNKITQFIFVKKASQKPILIGKEGKKIKEIGMRARKDIQKKINKRIYLELKVKISK